MKEDHRKHSVNTTSNRVDRVGGRRIFRLDSSAYNHQGQKHLSDEVLYTEPDDLIAPSIASSFTAQSVSAQIPENFRAFFADTKDDIRGDFTYDLGGHMAQTMEIPILNSDTLQAADTPFGIYLELEDTLPPSQIGLGSSMFPAPSASASPKTKTSHVQTQNPPPRWMPPLWLKRLFPIRLIAFLVLAILLFTPLTFFSTILRVVHLTIDGQPAGYLITGTLDAEGILQRAGLSPGPEDDYTLASCGLEARLDFWRAARVMLHCDGQQQTFYALRQTVEEALVSLGVELGPDDECNLPFDHILDDRDELIVYRVRYEENQRTESLPWQEILKPSPLIAAGTTMIMNPGGGRDGAALRTYQDKYVNGELWDSVIQNEKITSFPRNVVTLQGQADAIMSTVDGSDFTDIEIVNNTPTDYQQLLSAQPCTAYSFAPGCYGASGMFLFQGFVAVNPAVIPLGSLLYITSPNGRFIYGWAIAADVGDAMVDGRVTIDCFFETYRESVLFGRRTMNIYVIKQLTQAELEPYIAVGGMFRNRIPAN